MDSVSLKHKLGEAFEFLEDENYAKAFISFKRLVLQASRVAKAWLGYGSAACGLGKLEIAEQAWQRAKELEPHNTEILLKIGYHYQEARQLEKAQTHYEAAAAADPGAINPRICMALILEKLHRFADAREIVEKCFAIDGADEQARYVSALLYRREHKLEKAESQLRGLIACNPRHEYVRYAARYELAQILDRTDRFDEAMECLEEAKGLVRALADAKILVKNYDDAAAKLRSAARESPKNILRTWAKLFPEKSRQQIPRLAFLGGHPRSGTTLLEQVLGSHPEVGAVDEPAVTGFAVSASSQLSWGPPAPRLNVARRCYTEALQRMLGVDADKKLLLEKNPSPTAQLPVLLRLFPELRVIIALRDPRDVVLSCYFQNIPLNPTNANFLSFERLAVHYSNLMDVWLAVREWEGFSWMEARYEDTVLNLEHEGRRATQFLGLQWHETQARYFEANKNTNVFSPTYHEVTQPVYSHAVGRWRNYEKYLEPILPKLRPYCRAFGYDEC